MQIISSSSARKWGLLETTTKYHWNLLFKFVCFTCNYLFILKCIGHCNPMMYLYNNVKICANNLKKCLKFRNLLATAYSDFKKYFVTYP